MCSRMEYFISQGVLFWSKCTFYYAILKINFAYFDDPTSHQHMQDVSVPQNFYTFKQQLRPVVLAYPIARNWVFCKALLSISFYYLSGKKKEMRNRSSSIVQF